MPPNPVESTYDEKKQDYCETAEDSDSLDVDSAAERRLVRKLDLRLLPCLALTYLLAFLDRTNAGNARVAGLATELHLGNWGFNIGTCLYYVMLIVCEIPAAMLVRKFGNRLVPLAVIAFGIITIGTGFIHNRSGFYAVKSLLGIAESFVLPGNSYIITQFYRRSEFSVRIGFFIFSAGYLSGAFGGLLASAFLRLPPIGSVHTWRHIFVWEGLITAGTGIFLFFLYPNRSETTTMLSEEERKLTALRVGSSVSGSKRGEFTHLSLTQVKEVVFNPIVLAATWFYIIDSVTVTGMTVFAPTILALNYPHASPIRIQLLSVPPNICAWALSLSLVYFAMRYKKHAAAALVGALLTLAGYGTWLATDPTFIKTRYACLFLNTMGGSYGPIILAWTVSNARTDSERALTAAMIGGTGAIGSIVGSWSYFPTDAKTGYHIGNTLNVSLAAVVTAGIAALWWFEFRYNKKKGSDSTFKYVL
ncbi:major facilitator superfamily domain-containing protein [Mycena albidolilacea]|uniref:Major facilitator superfamily domain-containing protein n=1 Tax=Mycena albidolilacea TaxID=1033008 RepID=A0AAD7AHC0_9AGAR|nr:major facilitator superfamily domain-containing protein [Mycena albidolilacea]